MREASGASWRANSAPSPEDAPVITAVQPSKNFMMCERMVGPCELASSCIYEREAWLVSRYCAVKGG